MARMKANRDTNRRLQSGAREFMRGPGYRYDIDIRRLWECPACGKQMRLPGHLTYKWCRCRDEPVFMKLLDINWRRAFPTREKVVIPDDPPEVESSIAEKSAEVVTTPESNPVETISIEHETRESEERLSVESTTSLEEDLTTEAPRDVSAPDRTKRRKKRKRKRAKKDRSHPQPESDVDSTTSLAASQFKDSSASQDGDQSSPSDEFGEGV